MKLEATPLRGNSGLMHLMLAVVLMVWFYSPTLEVADPTLDVSNYVSYAHFTATGAQYGEQVIPMAGPYGFVMYGTVYGGDLFWFRFGLELLSKFCFGLLAVWFFRQIKNQPIKLAWVLGLLVLIPSVNDSTYAITILLAGIYLATFDRSRRSTTLRLGAVTLLIALLALMKGTQLSLAFLTVAVFSGQLIMERDWRNLRLIALFLPLALSGWWLLAGQNLGQLPAYFWGIKELSSGYNASMGLQEPPFAFNTAFGALVALAIMLIGAGFYFGKDFKFAGALLLIGAFSFIAWKHGFVRADGHVFIFYRYAGFLALTVVALMFTIPAAAGTDRFLQRGMIGFAAIPLGLGAVGDGQNSTERWRWELWRLPGVVGQNFQQIIHIRDQHHELEEELQRARAHYNLPRLQNLVADHSIDFFGSEHGYLRLNHLRYTPRPMGGGSFNVFTSALQNTNAAFVADSTRAPRYYLVNLGTIDNRFIAQDDGPALIALLQHYQPVAGTQGMLLFSRSSSPVGQTQPREIQRKAVRFDEWIEVPPVSAGEMLLMNLAVPLDGWGKTREFFYKPPMLYGIFSGPTVNAGAYQRIIPTMVDNPVLLFPFLESTQDLLDVFKAGAGKEIQRFKLSSPLPAYWQEQNFEVVFHVLPRPQTDLQKLSALREQFEYPTAYPTPISKQPTDAPLRIFDGLMVQMLEAPGFLEFELTGDERILEFGFGMDDAAWQIGETDGVAALIELMDPNGKGQVIFRRDLRPATDPRDRGMQTVIAPLPTAFAPGSRLLLRTDPGPHGSGAWDWAYVTKVWLRSGPFHSLQFPSFDTLPDQIDADYCGAIALGDRQVVLMNAPGAMTFPLVPENHLLSFDAGLVPGAYLEGQTDGADYVVEMIDIQGIAHEIWRRELRPLTNEADRGDIACRVPLNPDPNHTRLRLRIDAGPAGNLAWDWTYLTNLRIE